MSTKATATKVASSLAMVCTLIGVPSTQASAESKLDPRTPVAATIEALPSINKKRVATYNGIINDHLEKNLSILRTVRILTTHYPQDVQEIYLAAINSRPAQLTLIGRAIIRSEPALMHDIVDIALTIAPDQYEQIITMAIEAEPAYIDDVVSLAAKHHPQRLDEIIRVAISSEPQLSNSVIHSAAISAPNSFISAIMSTLTTLPDATVNILTAMKDFLSGEQSETNKIKISNTEEQWQVFIRQAKNQGVTKEEMRWFQKQGYITEKQLATVYIDSAE